MTLPTPADEETLFGDFFVNVSYVTKAFTFGEGTHAERTLSLAVSSAACTDFDLTGQLDWPGARLMCAWLAKQPNSLFSSTACELGAGTGLAGLYWAARGGRCVLTDYHPVVLSLLARNAAAFPSASVASLPWGDAAAAAALLNTQLQPPSHCNACGELSPPLVRGFPVLLLADVVYPGSQACLPLLMSSVTTLLRRDGVAFLCYCSRSGVTDAALAAAISDAGLTYCVADRGEAAREGGVDGTVYELRRAISTTL